MMLTELERVPAAALPLEICKAHLRMGTGFADEGGQDGLIERYLRAALQAIEARTGKALLQRPFRLRLPDWRDGHGEPLPLAPVPVVVSVTLVDRHGEAVTVDPARWRLEPDTHRPLLRPTGWLLPSVPLGGAAEIVFVAGFGPDWADVPADLAQAVLMLAAQYHEAPQGMAGGASMPFGVVSLVERWRVVRSMGGGVR